MEKCWLFGNPKDNAKNRPKAKHAPCENQPEPG
jgi:hypothetical protein